MRFYLNLFWILTKSLFNNYNDNYDKIIFKDVPEKRKKWKSYVLLYLRFIKGGSGNYFKIGSHLYNELSDKPSKKLLIKVFAFRILGHQKVKLPFNNKFNLDRISQIESYLSKDDFIESNYNKMKLFKYDLNKISFINRNVKFYFNSFGINVLFCFKQYEYKNKNFEIKAKLGDNVIDCGGCWGDTALYFADSVGSEGSCHVYEFEDNNLFLMKSNFKLNPELEQRIHIIENAVWSESDLSLGVSGQGPATKVELIEYNDKSKANKYNKVVKTLTIDDYFRKSDLESVEFIKMDIEGAEVDALNGAEDVIKKFNPTLAISLYHFENHFHIIPKLIHEFNPKYKFYLTHSTMTKWETVLFAIIK